MAGSSPGLKEVGGGGFEKFYYILWGYWKKEKEGNVETKAYQSRFKKRESYYHNHSVI